MHTRYTHGKGKHVHNVYVITYMDMKKRQSMAIIQLIDDEK